MSTNSPAKLERIERHLMRQRGAGVRTVSASFGFSFGTSSSDPTPAPEEPAPKRRKTILQNVVLATESTVVVKPEAIVPDATEIVQPRKARRRLDLENDVRNTARAHATDANDSFVCSLETKRTAAKKNKEAVVSAKSEQQADVAVVEPAAKGRPRRRAAATAAIKVTDGFADEALSVDKKRRDAEPEKKPKRTRKQQDGVVESSSKPSEDSVRLEKANESIANRPVKGTSKRPKTKKAAVEVPEEIYPPYVDQVEIVDSEDEVLPAKPKKSTSRKRKKSDPAIDCPATREVDDAQQSKPQPKLEKHLNDAVNTAEDIDVPKKRSRKEMVKEITSDKSFAAGTTSELRRQPLKETDMNLTIRSTSPEKTCTNDEKVPPIHKETMEKSKHPATTEHTTARPSKRRKVQVRQDHEDLEANLENDAVQRNRAVIEEISRTVGEGQFVRSADVTKPEEKLLGVTNATMSTVGKIKKSTRTDSSEPKRTLREARTEDEDVDWLFEPQEPKQQPILSQNKAPPFPAATKARTKTPDIDLDDLLSNIASFAKTESLYRIENGSGVGGKKAKTSAGQRRKG